MRLVDHALRVGIQFSADVDTAISARRGCAGAWVLPASGSAVWHLLGPRSSQPEPHRKAFGSYPGAPRRGRCAAGHLDGASAGWQEQAFLSWAWRERRWPGAAAGAAGDHDRGV